MSGLAQIAGQLSAAVDSLLIRGRRHRWRLPQKTTKTRWFLILLQAVALVHRSAQANVIKNEPLIRPGFIGHFPTNLSE
jgi:hypothetical protein